jgi:hypothetical protein
MPNSYGAASVAQPSPPASAPNLRTADDFVADLSGNRARRMTHVGIARRFRSVVLQDTSQLSARLLGLRQFDKPEQAKPGAHRPVAVSESPPSAPSTFRVRPTS